MKMNIKLRWPSAAWVYIFMLCLASNTMASQIPLGIDWRNRIFIQEYLAGDKPHFCIANFSDQDIPLQISNWHPGKTVEPLKVVPLSENAIECLNAQPFMDKRYLDFRVLKGPRLGLLRPHTPPEAGNETKAVTIKSYLNLNGACNNVGITLEQRQIWLKSGQDVSLTLTTPANNGKIIFKRELENRYLPEIIPDKILSVSLPVETEKDQIIINTDKPIKKHVAHAIMLKFVAPTVENSKMFKISAKVKLSEKNWSCFVRGILIKP